LNRDDRCWPITTYCTAVADRRFRGKAEPKGVRTTAVRRGNGYVLSGSKTFITDGQHTNLERCRQRDGIAG